MEKKMEHVSKTVTVCLYDGRVWGTSYGALTTMVPLSLELGKHAKPKSPNAKLQMLHPTLVS